MGRLWIRLDHLVLVVSVPALPSSTIALAKPSGLIKVWNGLSPAQRQALEDAGYTNQTFEIALIRHFDVVCRRRSARLAMSAALPVAA